MNKTQKRGGYIDTQEIVLHDESIIIIYIQQTVSSTHYTAVIQKCIIYMTVKIVCILYTYNGC